MVKEKNIPDEVRSLQEEIVRLRKEKDIEIKKLTKQLNEEKLKNMANEMIIDIAEKTFRIPIGKKSADRQSQSCQPIPYIAAYAVSLFRVQ